MLTNVVKVEYFVMITLIVRIQSEILLVLVIRALMEMVSTAQVIFICKSVFKIIIYLKLVIDVNECLLSNGCHENAECLNLIGSYDCKCQTGYSGNGFNCTSQYKNCLQVLCL